MKPTALLLAPLAAACLSGGALAAAPQPLGCLIEPYQVAEVGSPVIGVIERLHAERGDTVRRGQALAVLRTDVERASVGVAASRAQASAEVEAASANAILARQKLARAEDLVARAFLSPQSLDQARAEARVAEERLAQTREARRTAEREHELAQAQLALRTIRAPSDGVVADRYLAVGERVEEKPLFRVAMIDPLRVEVVLPSALFGVLRPGETVRVTPEFPGAAPREAKVVLVDKLVDGVSNTFRVRLSLPNPGGSLPAGLRCKADLGAAVAALPVPPKPAVAPPERARSGLQPAAHAAPANAAAASSARHGATGLRLDTRVPPTPRPRI
ncbi:MAG: efflux RND transporter periplasmic adaptor subunit [Burkholderiales bacterium]|nr:efflux RND transporter periplasmic adaptor subunit [Burkholderiales bacterium]